MVKKILIINGPNLEMLGKRDKSKYGDFSLENLMTMLSDEASKLGCEVEFFQNKILFLVVKISKKVDFLVNCK